MIIYDLPEREYHADPMRDRTPGGSLSSTEARMILQAPALLRWHRDNPAERRTPSMDFGTAVHTMVLGTGAQPVAYPDEVLSPTGRVTSEARAWADSERAAGRVPMRDSDYRRARAAADTVLTHPVMASLLDSDAATPEVSVFSEDPETGVTMRGRLDLVSANHMGPVIVDLKTAPSAHPGHFSRHAAQYGYDVQMVWYLKAWEQETQESPYFIHMVVSRDEPHLVSACEMDWAYHDLGEAKTARALRLYRDCLRDDQWPGIPPEIYPITPPAYYIDLDEGE